MSALIPELPNYLDRLAALAKSNANAADLTCQQLADCMRYAVALEDRGVTTLRLRVLARLYAVRLDMLGADEFDRRSLLGA
jgi:hypothetical protein